MADQSAVAAAVAGRTAATVPPPAAVASVLAVTPAPAVHVASAAAASPAVVVAAASAIVASAAAASAAAAAAPLPPLPPHVVTNGIALVCADCEPPEVSLASLRCLDCSPMADLCDFCSEQFHSLRRVQSHKLARILYQCSQQCSEQFALHDELKFHQTSCAAAAALAEAAVAAPAPPVPAAPTGAAPALDVRAARSASTEAAEAAAAAALEAAAMAEADHLVMDARAWDEATAAAASAVHPQAAALARSMRANPADIMVPGRCSECPDPADIFCVNCNAQCCHEHRIVHRQDFPDHAVELVRGCPACLHVFVKYSELLLHDCVPRTKLSQEESHPPPSPPPLSLSWSRPNSTSSFPSIYLRGRSPVSIVYPARLDHGSNEQMQVWLAYPQGAPHLKVVVRIIKSLQPHEHTFAAAKQTLMLLRGIDMQANHVVQLIDGAWEAPHGAYKVEFVVRDQVDVHYKCCILLEYCEGGTLQELIHEHGALSEKEARRYLQQIKIGMEFLRNHKISHQNLSASHLLLRGGNLKINGFGFALPHTDGRPSAESQIYIAPELLQLDAKKDRRADLWTMGALLFFMLDGSVVAHKRTYLFDHNGAFVISRVLDLRVSQTTKNLLFALLQIDPAKRITWSAFVDHPFWQEPRSAQPSASVRAPRQLVDRGSSSHGSGSQGQAHHAPKAVLPIVTAAAVVAAAIRAATELDELEPSIPDPITQSSIDSASSAVLESPPECALTGEQRLLLRRLLTASMMLGATRAKAHALLAEAAPPSDAVGASAAAEAAAAVAAHAALTAYSELLKSAYLIAFRLQLAIETDDHRAKDYRAQFFRLIYATLCRLHVAGSAAAPYCLLHFLGDPLVSELRAQCIRHLNTQDSAHWRHAVEILSILLKALLTPSATALEREQWIQNLEQSGALSSHVRARMRAARTALILSSKAHRDGLLHDGPLYAVQRIPWTNLKLVDSVRAAVGALDDQESFQLDSIAAQQVDKAVAVAAGKEEREEWRRMPGAPTPEEMAEAEAMKRAQ